MSLSITYRGPQWVMPQLTLGAMECIVCCCSLAYSLYVYKTYRNVVKKSTTALSNSLKFLNLFGIVSFLFSAISHCINIYVWNTFYWQYSNVQTLTFYLTYLCWSFGQFTSYLLFVNRINVTFKHSIYEPTKLTTFFLYALAISFILTWTAANIVPVFTENIDRNYLIEFYISIPIIVEDILLTISMTYIFTSRLYAVILAQTRNEYREYVNTYENKQTPLILSASLVNRQMAMIKLSVKITILTVTSLVSSLILITFRSISYWHKWGTPLDKFHTIWLQMDTMISCLCLLLFLPKTQKCFDVFCCCCTVIVSKLMKRSLHKQTLLDSLRKTISINSTELTHSSHILTHEHSIQK